MKDIVSLRHRLQHHHRQLFTPPLPDIQVSTSREAAAEGHTGSKRDTHGLGGNLHRVRWNGLKGGPPQAGGMD